MSLSFVLSGKLKMTKNWVCIFLLTKLRLALRLFCLKNFLHCLCCVKSPDCQQSGKCSPGCSVRIDDGEDKVHNVGERLHRSSKSKNGDTGVAVGRNPTPRATFWCVMRAAIWFLATKKKSKSSMWCVSCCLLLFPFTGVLICIQEVIWCSCYWHGSGLHTDTTNWHSKKLFLCTVKLCCFCWKFLGVCLFGVFPICIIAAQKG